MKKNLMKLAALVLAVMMVASVAWADDIKLLENGTVGSGGSTATKIDGEKVVILKELRAYNQDAVNVKAPTITYNYKITAGSADKSVIDKDSVSVLTKAGVGTPTITASVSWTTTDELETTADGKSNTKEITVDFSGVNFGAAGVYRYVITESLADTFTYANTGVTETTNTANKHVRYLDVYVKDGTGTSGADAWDVYGFALFTVDNAIEYTTDGSVANAKKTTGFVDADDELADQYYTYNLTVSKKLEGDNSQNSHPFPITINYTNDTITKDIALNTVPSGTVKDYTRTGTIGGQDGIVTLTGGGDGSSIKYIGIPAGTSVSVYETNDVTGTTYKATTTTDGTADDGKSISWTTAPTAAAAYTVQAYNSLEASITSTANQKDTTSHTVAIENVFELISPTGVVLRVAPYALILLAGVALLVISRRRRVAE